MTDQPSFASYTQAMQAGEWRLRLAELCRDCSAANGGEEAGPLRLAWHLLAKAPDGAANGMGAMVHHLPTRPHFEALLALRAYDSAALALMPDQAAYILSRSASGDYLASVLLPHGDEEMTAQAPTLALALVSALLACLARIAGGAGGDWPMPPGASLH